MLQNSASINSQVQSVVANPVELPLLTKSAVDPYVSLLQRFLVVYGHLKSVAGTNSVDGVFDSKTLNAVAEFQRFHNVQPDGQVGAITWYAIAHPNAKTPQSLTPIANVRSTLPNLQNGNYGPLVTVLQRLLTIYSQAANKYIPGEPLPEAFVDGDFGKNTEAVVRRFQEARKSVYPALLVTGIVDALTWDALVYPKGKN
ncbi:peptidoglycan-binding protein [Phormidium tenue FACHB-886]|nr:peptidoglycan-binding protein [Phormidium tenue FACHB-886]